MNERELIVHSTNNAILFRKVKQELQLIYKDDKGRFGWETNLTTKPKMMVELSTAVNNEHVDVPSVPIQNEMRRYDKEDLSTARFDEEATQHWDLLIATAIGFQLRDYVIMEKDQAHVYIPED